MNKLILSFVCVALLLEGCKSSPQKIAFQGATTTQVSVDFAMKQWANYVTVKHPPVEQEIQVKVAYQRYQAAMLVVCDAGATYATSTTDNVAQNAGVLQIAVTALTSSIGDLENLMTQFGVKL